MYDSLYTELGPKAYPAWLLMRAEEQHIQFDNNPTHAAWIFGALGQKEKALDWLEIAYERHDGKLVNINRDPKWDMIRDDPGFQDLLRRMNFPN